MQRYALALALVASAALLTMDRPTAQPTQEQGGTSPVRLPVAPRPSVTVVERIRWKTARPDTVLVRDTLFMPIAREFFGGMKCDGGEVVLTAPPVAAIFAGSYDRSSGRLALHGARNDGKSYEAAFPDLHGDLQFGVKDSTFYARSSRWAKTGDRVKRALPLIGLGLGFYLGQK